MKIYSTLFVFSLAVSTVCLGFGLFSAESWATLAALLILFICWLAAAKRSENWLATSAFIGYLSLAAAAVLLDVSMYLMLTACVASMVSWEVIWFKNVSRPSQTSGPALTRIEGNHLRSLGLASVLGLTAALLALQIRMEIPFWIVVILSLMLMAALVFGLRYIQENSGKD